MTSGRFRILVACTKEDNIDSLVGGLRAYSHLELHARRGIEVTVALDMVHALQLIVQNRNDAAFNLLIVEHNLWVSRRASQFMKIKETQSDVSIPLVVMAIGNEPDEGDREAACRAGADLYLPRYFRMSQFFYSLNQLLQSRDDSNLGLSHNSNPLKDLTRKAQSNTVSLFDCGKTNPATNYCQLCRGDSQATTSRENHPASSGKTDVVSVRQTKA